MNLLFEQIRSTKPKVFSKDFHATELLECWQENAVEINEYDNLIISFLETLPEDVSVKSTLINALTACLDFRRANIHDNAIASQACALAGAIRRQLLYWDPETESN